MDPKTQEAIAGIHDGSLAASLHKNLRFSLAGIAIGWAAGIVIATLTGQSRVMFALSGAAVGLGVGYISSGTKKK